MDDRPDMRVSHGIARIRGCACSNAAGASSAAARPQGSRRRNAGRGCAAPAKPGPCSCWSAAGATLCRGGTHADRDRHSELRGPRLRRCGKTRAAIAPARAGRRSLRSRRAHRSSIMCLQSRPDDIASSAQAAAVLRRHSGSGAGSIARRNRLRTTACPAGARRSAARLRSGSAHAPRRSSGRARGFPCRSTRG